jgi:hypothetical protein
MSDWQLEEPTMYAGNEPVRSQPNGVEWEVRDAATTHFYDAHTGKPLCMAENRVLHPIWGTARRPARPQ